MAPRSAEQSSAAAAQGGLDKPLRARPMDSKMGKDGASYFPKDVAYYHVPRMGEKYVGLLGDHHIELPWYKRVDWIGAPVLLLSPFLALYGIYTTPFNWKTYAFAVFWYFVTGFGITGGRFSILLARPHRETVDCRCFTARQFSLPAVPERPQAGAEILTWTSTIET